MGKSTPSPPPAPDPYATADAQTKSNVNTGIANTVMGNADQYGPDGTVKYNQRGTVNVNGQDIPQYDRVTTLSPDAQRLYDLQSQLGLKANEIALGQTDKIGGILNQTVAPAPTLKTVSDYLGGDLSGTRDRVETALMARLNPQLAAGRSSLDARLAAEGLDRSSEAFRNAADESNRQENDARLAVIGAAGTEQDRTFNEALASAGFDNSVAQQGWTNALAARTQPINEISALMGLGQVSLPQAPAYNPGQVAGTPVGQYVYQSAAQNLDAWKTEQATRASTLGSLFGLGASVAGAFAKCDRRLKRDIAPLGVRLPNKLPLYAFRYISGGEAGPMHVGVMANEAEIIPGAVITGPGGFKLVDYGKSLLPMVREMVAAREAQRPARAS